MLRFNVVIVAVACLLGVVAGAAPARAQTRPPLPDFGLLYNNDGDIMFEYAQPSLNDAFLRARLDELKNTPIQTYMWCIGTDILHYPSQVGSTWGWRTTPYDNDPAWSNRINYGRSYVQQNYDPIMTVANKIKAMGKRFVPSYRMNDDHFVVDPQNYPLTGRFWLDNQDKTIGTSPVQGYNYSNLLNYEHQAVRDYRMAVINESIDRYANVMDGYELDFNRVQIFFSPGEADTHKALITDMVQQVREKLDQVAAATDRPQYLFVRTPPALHNNQWAGLEVEKWIRERTVDVVIPSVLQTMSHDVPVRQFIDIAQQSGSGVKVAPAIYPRTNTGYNLKPRPAATGGYTGAQNFRVASTELARGAASNYRYLGTDGVQMYNWGVSWPDNWYDSAESMGSSEPTLGKDRVFAITPAYFTDNENTFEYSKQVPQTVNPLASKSFTMIVGDDINRMIRERPDDVVLRLGLTGTAANRPMTLSINGRQLHAGQMGAKYLPVTLPASSDTPTAYFQVAVDDLRALLRGDNTITVQNTGFSSGIRITDMQLGVFGTSVPGAGPVESRREPDPSMLRHVYEDGSGPTLTYTINDRDNNGFSQGLGGVYFTGQTSSTLTPYNRAAGFAFDQAMYYPSVEGSLESLDYSFYLSKTSGSRPTSLVSLMLMQDGKIYSVDERFSIENGDAVLSKTITDSSLTASDFLMEKPNGDGFVLDPTMHPDFSTAGSPLYFGWLLSRAANPAVGGNDQPYTDLDDLLLTFHAGAPVLDLKWNVDAGGNWNNVANWTPTVPNGAGAIAVFGDKIAAPRTVTVGSPVYVGRIDFDNAYAYTIAGTNPITVSGTGAAEINVLSGHHAITAPLLPTVDMVLSVAGGASLNISNLNPSATITINKANEGTATVNRVRAKELRVSAGVLAVAANGGNDATSRVESLLIIEGMLDLNDNDVIVDYAVGDPSPEFTLRDHVKAIIDGGTVGIRFTPGIGDVVIAFAEKTEWGMNEFNGFALDDTTVIGKYTYYGDANLDGRVTSDDYVAVDVGLGSGDSWVQGDFNFSGTVTSDDYVAIDVNLGKGTPTPLAWAELKAEMIALHTDLFGAEYLEKLAYAEANGFGATLVPEPGSLGVVIAGALGALCRRRRRSLPDGQRRLMPCLI